MYICIHMLKMNSFATIQGIESDWKNKLKLTPVCVRRSKGTPFTPRPPVDSWGSEVTWVYMSGLLLCFDNSQLWA